MLAEGIRWMEYYFGMHWSMSEYSTINSQESGWNIYSYMQEVYWQEMSFEDLGERNCSLCQRRGSWG